MRTLNYMFVIITEIFIVALENETYKFKILIRVCSYC